MIAWPGKGLGLPGGKSARLPRKLKSQLWTFDDSVVSQLRASSKGSCFDIKLDSYTEDSHKRSSIGKIADKIRLYHRTKMPYWKG
jgi:hypothetical protein